MADLTAEFVDKVTSLARVEEFEHHGLNYTSKPIHIVNPPKIAKANVITLKALADLYENDFEGIKDDKVVFHVTSETTVEVYGNDSDDYSQRTVYASAKAFTSGAFSFGQWMDQETFIIGLQTFMKAFADRDYLLNLTSKITTAEALEVIDNGTSQEFTAKAGTSLKSHLEPKPRVSLSPFRTFREIEQPVSEFVFRVRKSGRGTPELALFEADGGAWKLTAMASIAEHLNNAIANDAATVIY